MIRSVQVGSKWYATAISAIEDDAVNIGYRVKEGKPVIIVDEMETLRELLGADAKIVEVD